MTSTLKISVLMPFRDAAATIEAAVRSMLAQSHRDLEVLAIDDGSSDDSRRRLEELAPQDERLRVLGDERRLGISPRLNQGIDAARGALIARMDADDVSHPRRLELQAARLESEAELDLVGSSMVILRGAEPIGIRRLPESHGAIVGAAWRGVALAHPTFLGRAEWFRRHRYAEEFDLAQDQELLLRAARCSRYANVFRPLLAYRQGANRSRRREARRFRREAVAREAGRLAALARLLADALAEARTAVWPEPREAVDPDEVDAWRVLAQSGRWTGPGSPS